MKRYHTVIRVIGRDSDGHIRDVAECMEGGGLNARKLKKWFPGAASYSRLRYRIPCITGDFHTDSVANPGPNVS